MYGIHLTNQYCQSDFHLFISQLIISSRQQLAFKVSWIESVCFAWELVCEHPGLTTVSDHTQFNDVYLIGNVVMKLIAISTSSHAVQRQLRAKQRQL